MHRTVAVAGALLLVSTTVFSAEKGQFGVDVTYGQQTDRSSTGFGFRYQIAERFSLSPHLGAMFSSNAGSSLGLGGDLRFTPWKSRFEPYVGAGWTHNFNLRDPNPTTPGFYAVNAPADVASLYLGAQFRLNRHFSVFAELQERKGFGSRAIFGTPPQYGVPVNSYTSGSVFGLTYFFK